MPSDFIDDEDNPQRCKYCNRVMDVLLDPCSKGTSKEKGEYVQSRAIDPRCRAELMKRGYR